MVQPSLDQMYADYKLEFENVHTIIEPGIGFANFSIEEERQKDLDIYVQEVYIRPSKRGNKFAAELTDYCIIEAELLTEKTVKTIYTTVAIGGNTTNLSLRAITAYGFKILKSNEKLIYFYKELNNE